MNPCHGGYQTEGCGKFASRSAVHLILTPQPIIRRPDDVACGAKDVLDWRAEVGFNPAQLKRSILSSTTQRTGSYFGNPFGRFVAVVMRTLPVYPDTDLRESLRLRVLCLDGCPNHCCFFAALVRNQT